MAYSKYQGMKDGEVPAGVSELLAAHVETYEELELLVLIGRASGAVAWADVHDRTAFKDALPATVRRLTQIGLVELTPRGELRAPGALTGVLGELADAYANSPSAVLGSLSANALQRLRSAASRNFAASLPLRKLDEE